MPKLNSCKVQERNSSQFGTRTVKRRNRLFQTSIIQACSYAARSTRTELPKQSYKAIGTCRTVRDINMYDCVSSVLDVFEFSCSSRRVFAVFDCQTQKFVWKLYLHYYYTEIQHQLRLDDRPVARGWNGGKTNKQKLVHPKV